MILLIIRFYSNKGQLNLSVNEINSIADISKTLFVSGSSLLSPSSKIFVIAESRCLKRFHLLDLSCQRGFSLHNDDWDSEGGSELLFQYPDHNNT